MGKRCGTKRGGSITLYLMFSGCFSGSSKEADKIMPFFSLPPPNFTLTGVPSLSSSERCTAWIGGNAGTGDDYGWRLGGTLAEEEEEEGEDKSSQDIQPSRGGKLVA